MLFSFVPEEFCQSPAMRGPPSCRYRYLWNPRSLSPILMSPGRYDSGQARQAGGGEAPCRRGCQKMQMSECCKKTTLSETQDKRDADLQRRKPIAMFDFRGFAPEEIKVKMTETAVVVRGDHADNFGSMHVTRTTPLPPGADKTGVVCRLINGHVVVMHASRGLHEKSSVGSPASTEQKTEKKAEEGSSDCTKDQESDEQRRFEQNIQTLGGLFSVLFGLHGEERSSETEKTGDEDETKAEKEEKKHQGEDVQCKESVTEDQNAQTAESEKGPGDKRDEDTCPMLKYDQKQMLEDEDEFIRIEKDELEVGQTDHEDAANTYTMDDTKPRNELEEQAVQNDVKEDPNSHVINIADDKRESDEEKQTGFRVNLDLSKFKLESIRVVFREGGVIVEAEREIETEGHTEVERVSRRIKLPADVDESKLESVLNEQGVLAIRAPLVAKQRTWKNIVITKED